MTQLVDDTRGWEVIWTNGLGQEQRMLVMDRDRALIYAARYNGRIKRLIWGPE